MSRIQNTINWMSLTAQLSHFFCCGIPILVSLFSLAANIGLLASMPIGLEMAHDVMHDYEVPLIIMSATILFAGWGLHFVADRIDCLKTGCAHEPCGAKKKRSSKILMIATALFVVNLVSYFALHLP